MANVGMTVYQQDDGVQIKVGCKSFTLKHRIGNFSRRVNNPISAEQKRNFDGKLALFKDKAAKWAADGGEGKPPAKPKRPTAGYSYVDYVGFGISCRLGYDTVEIEADKILKLAEGLINYYERVKGLEDQAKVSLAELQDAYKKASNKSEKAAAKPSLANVKKRIEAAAIAALPKKKARSPKKKVA